MVNVKNTINELKGKFKLRQLLLTIILTALIVIGFMMQPYRFGGSVNTKSIKCRAFIWEKKNADTPLEYKPGDYVTFKFSRDDLPPQNYEFFKKMKFVKKVGCAPGDILECGFGVCSCNGEIILSAISEKFAAQAFSYSGQIPPTHVFLIGDNDKSYDGRYWGLTSVNSLVGVIKQCLYTSEQ